MLWCLQSNHEEAIMYLRTMRAVLARCETEHRFWHGAQIVCTPDGKVRMQTLWRNPELAGIWQLSYALSGACLDSLLRHRRFVLEQETAHCAQVYRFVK